MSSNQDSPEQEEHGHLPERLPQMEGYVSVREAAEIMGVSTRSVYGYLETGRLQGVRIGASVAVRAEEVRQYKRPVVGRPRTHIPPWRTPIAENPQYLTCICVRFIEGQSEQLEPRLAEIRQGARHAIPGTVGRYIMRNHRDPALVQIVLVWRKMVMPPEEERQAAITALCGDLADILNWETATFHEGKVLLNT